MGLFNNQNGTQQATQQAAPLNDPFAAIGNAEPSERSTWILPGVYSLLYCQQLKMITSQNTGTPMFIAEFDILESGVKERPAGSSMTWICNMIHKPSPGNVRAFIAALFNTSVEEVDGDSARAVCGPDNPAMGRLIRCEATETLTKSNKPFTQCKWVAIDGDVQQKAEELRSAAFTTPF